LCVCSRPFRNGLAVRDGPSAVVLLFGSLGRDELPILCRRLSAKGCGLMGLCAGADGPRDRIQDVQKRACEGNSSRARARMPSRTQNNIPAGADTQTRTHTQAQTRRRVQTHAGARAHRSPRTPAGRCRRWRRKILSCRSSRRSSRTGLTTHPTATSARSSVSVGGSAG
jgi:hypothetical protein